MPQPSESPLLENTQIRALHALTASCPHHHQNREPCPFSRLGMLSYHTRENIFRQMNSEDVVGLFRLAEASLCARARQECETILGRSCA